MPKVNEETIQQIRELFKQYKSVRKVAKIVGLDRDTVGKYVADLVAEVKEEKRREREERNQKIRKLREQGYTVQEIANMVGVSRHLVQSTSNFSTLTDGLLLRAIINPKGLSSTTKHRLAPIIQQFMQEDLPASLHLEMDSCIICADLHLPKVDWALLEEVLGYGEEFKNIIILGDLVDFQSISPWLPHFEIEDHQLSKELSATKQVLEELKNQYEQVVIISGNHELWLVKKLEGKIEFPSLLKLLVDGIITTPYPMAFLNEQWLLIHPTSYRKNPLSLAKDLSLTYPQYNIILSHYHRYVKMVWNNRLLIEIPAMCDLNKMLYTYFSPSTFYHPVCNGYIGLQNNQLVLERIKYYQRV